MPHTQPSPDIPDFEMLRQVGRGGFGEVWLARNRATGHLRAVKVIPLRRAGSVDPAGREITSLTRLEANVRQKHPNLLDIHHVGRTEEHLFYVMDPADDMKGGRPEATGVYRPATLQQRLAAGPLPVEQCWQLTEQLLAGLGALHEAGMVHRDVKPANCLFVDGTLKLADFGLLTESHGAVSRIGTETYMPPDGRMDTRADVYAAGLVIYEMLTGLPARRFPTLANRADMVCSDRNMAVLNQLALAACQHEPERRPNDAPAMEQMLVDLSDEAQRSWVHSPTFRVLVMGSILAGLAFFVGAILKNAQREPETSPPAVVGVENERVAVSFITDPFEAEVLVDGQVLRKPDGTPYRTPATVPDLPAGPHEVAFRLEGRPDLPLGEIDFRKTREVEARFEP